LAETSCSVSVVSAVQIKIRNAGSGPALGRVVGYLQPDPTLFALLRIRDIAAGAWNAVLNAVFASC